MLFLDYGYGRQGPTWLVNENKAPGYSRVYLLDDGDVTYCDASRAIRLEKGHLYIFPSHAPFSIMQHPDNPISCLWLHLNFFPTLVTDLIDVPFEENAVLRNCLAAFFHEVTGKTARHSLLTAIAQAITECFYKSGCLSLPDPSTQRFLTYIEGRYNGPLTVDRMSQDFGYTTEHFIRLFRSKVGMTPHQYLTSCRLSKAAVLLREGKPVGETATRVGYLDQKTFSRAFRSHFGVAPYYYQQMEPAP